MFIKNILRAFDLATPIEVYLNDNLLEYGTVAEFMNSGLTTYATCEENDLYIEDGKIIIYLD